jgi:hypothetical protein
VASGSVDAAAEWFLNERGITKDTLREFGVTVRADGAIILPYPNGNKVRLGIPHGERKFFFDSGVKPGLFHEQDATNKHVFLVEGETDTMRLWQECRVPGEIVGGQPGVVGLSGIDTWQDSFADRFAGADRVYVVLDNDADYNVQARVDNSWRSIRAALGPKARRIRLPSDVKDVCEYFALYDLETLWMIVSNAVSLPGASRWKPLDLTSPPPPVKWLVNNLICRGDIHLEMGEPGIGKSWLTMDMCLAVAQGRPWLGHEVMEAGRVLYVDEENPPDLIFNRLNRLGMTPEDAKNIRYLNNQGILLDKDPDALVDEALEFQPHLIVLDSLTRFHAGDEDKAGSMATLYNTALKPLARETDAAVMLLHHAGKTEANSSYRRSRGSGEIIANADAGFDVRQAGINQLTIAQFKSRRRQAGDLIHVSITDTPEGGVALIGGGAPVPPF